MFDKSNSDEEFENELLRDIMNVPLHHLCNEKDIISDFYDMFPVEKEKNPYWKATFTNSNYGMSDDPRHNFDCSDTKLDTIDHAVLPEEGTWICVLPTGCLYDNSLRLRFIGRFPFGLKCLLTDDSQENKYDEFYEFESKMIKEYSRKLEQYKSSVYHIDQLVCVNDKITGMWYRGQILNIKKLKKGIVRYQIFFFDYGFTKLCDAADVHKLGNCYMTLPEQSVDFCLHNVILNAASKNKIKSYLNQKMKNTLLIGYINKIIDDIVFISLFNPQSSNFISLNQEINIKYNLK